MARARECIYCSRSDLPRGQGDHVLPAQFGKFTNQFKFHGICRKCNSALGACEEKLVRCGPESLFRNELNPPTGRRKPSTFHRPTKGAKPPEFCVVHENHLERARLINAVDRVIEPVDQLVVALRGRPAFYIDIPTHAPLAKVDRELDKLPVGDIEAVRLHVSDGRFNEIAAMLRRRFPDWDFEEQPGLPQGHSRVKCRIAFSIHPDYWRAIAKIAFHYYLLTNQRGFIGTEREFRPIREFVRDGVGDPARFVWHSPQRFLLPFGTRTCMHIPPASEWQHWLACYEQEEAVVAMVCLFAGPGHFPIPWQVRVADLSNHLFAAIPPKAHAYVYCLSTPAATTAGAVSARPIECTLANRPGFGLV